MEKPRITHTLDSPFPSLQWPLITSTDQQSILELLCSLLSPIGEHRREHVVPSKGKRSKRQRRLKNTEANTTAPSTPPRPELIQHVTIGFNSTVQRLQLRAPSAITPSAARKANLNSTKKLAAVFVCPATLPSLLTSSMPALVAAASAGDSSQESIRLVSLPPAAEKRLAEALFQPRVGFVGLQQDTPGGKAVIDVAREKTSPVTSAWSHSEARGKYLPVSIKISSSVPDRVEKKLLDKRDDTLRLASNVLS